MSSFMSDRLIIQIPLQVQPEVNKVSKVLYCNTVYRYIITIFSYCAVFAILLYFFAAVLYHIYFITALLELLLFCCIYNCSVSSIVPYLA